MGGSTPQAPGPTAPAPTPPPPVSPPTTPTVQQATNVGQRLYAAEGQQSTILSSNVNTNQDVVKKSILGG